MNGVTDGYADWLYADGDMPPDDDPEHWIAGTVTPDCPICARGLGWDGAVLFCENCEVVWHSSEELERDHRNMATLEEHMTRQS